MRPSSTIGFAARFIVGYALLMGAFEATRGTAFERAVVEQGLLRPTVAVLRILAPTEQVELVGRTLTSPGSRLRVVRGCEGVETLLLLVCAILAYPAPWRARARGLVLGALLAYLLSVSRLIALHLTLRHAPDLWETMHGLILPLAPVALIGVYFLRWSDGVARSLAAPSAHAA